MSARRSRDLTVTVNGIEHEWVGPPEKLLVEYLRSDLGLTGTQVGCETSSCGACTVVLDGQAAKACTMFTVQAMGSRVTTVEGLSDGGLHPLASAFLAERGFQCGYCTSGMIMAAAALLDQDRSPSASEIREALEGNLCRCTGYDTIVRSVLVAAEQLRGGAGSEPDRPEPLPGGGHISRGL